MHVAIISFLTGTLVTLSTASALPMTPGISNPLPDKFTITMTPNVANTGTDLDKFPSEVTVDEFAYTSPLGLGGIDHPGLTQILFIGYRSGADGVITPGWDGEYPITHVPYPMSIIPSGEVRFEVEPFGVSTGFVQVDGLLALDAYDGKGPLTTWMACPKSSFTSNWSVWWAPVGRRGCQGITLKVVPL